MRPAGPHRALIAVITVGGAVAILLPRRSHVSEKQVLPKIA
jgi:hypothetical protein